MRLPNSALEWASKVKSSYGRKQLSDYASGVRIINKLDLKSLYKDNSTTIIEAYPGPGVWTAALNNELKPKKHVVMEPHPQCFKYLKSLESPENNLKVLSTDPYRWRSFLELAEEGIYTPQNHPRAEGIHPQLLYTANLTMTQGEQLATQYLNCITNQSWLQAYGRVRLLLWVRQSTATKLMYGIGDRSRSRLSVQAEACTDITLASGDCATPDKRALEMLSKKEFFPERAGAPVLIQIDPKLNMPENLDSFEYVTKMLFIQRIKPLHEAITTLGAGAAEDLGPQLQDLMDVKPRDMSMAQLLRIVDTFEMWPFKPEILHDFYEQATGPSSTGFAF